jgi:thioesterase domain-containing protein
MPDNLVLLREQPGPAIAFVHPASGQATAFRWLLPHLRESGSVFAFTTGAPGPEDGTIATIAEEYWQQLRSHVRGPLVLAGWSFGGAVALRMASTAEAEGRGIHHVVLIDSGTPELLAGRTDSTIERLAGLFQVDATTLGHDEDPIEVDRALELVAARLRLVHSDERIDVADLRPFAAIHDWHLRVARRPWHPGSVSAPVLLVRARDEVGWHDAPDDLGWSSVLGYPPRTVWTAGTHYDLVSPKNAEHIARVLNGLLAESGPLERFA